MTRPLCSAAATAVLIDVDKGVRPCCAYFGNHNPGSPSVGKLGPQTLKQIVDGPAWQQVRQQLADHDVPVGCADCIKRERLVGWSERLTIESRRSANWERGITYFELDSSNLCNLQCRHCSGHFSSRWATHDEHMGRRHAPIVMPDAEMLLANLREMDLRYVEVVSLKGGEPMLNSDARVLLQHLDEIGVLPNVSLYMVTNGTVTSKPLLELMARAKRRQIVVSVDGVGPAQTYIRHGGSDIEKIERSIAIYAAMPGTQLTRNTSVMAYNVFGLDRIDAWWESLVSRFPGDYAKHFYGLFVMDPAHLWVTVLQDHTRAALRARYEALDPKAYAPIVRALNLPFAGARLHDLFVTHTRRVDRELGRSVLDAIPELADEMVLLAPPAPPVAEPVAAAVPAVAAPPAAPTPASEPAPRQAAAAVAAAVPAAPFEPQLAARVDALWQALANGDLATARVHAKAAAAGDAANLRGPMRVAVLHAHGAVMALGGEFAAALEFLNDALSLSPQHLGVRVHRARVLEALGRRAEAIADARLASADPDAAAQARELLARCAAT